MSEGEDTYVGAVGPSWSPLPLSCIDLESGRRSAALRGRAGHSTDHLRSRG